MLVEKEKYMLKQWLGIRGLTQTELAEATGVTEQTVNKLANNPDKMESAKYSTLKAIAKALDIEVQDLKELS